MQDIILSKTDYLLFRECKKNLWYKVHQPDLYWSQELSDFEKQIIETGNEVELVARQLFIGGVLVEGRDLLAEEKTQELLNKKTPVIFQAVFKNDYFFAAVDVLEYKPDGSWHIFEIKATSDVDKKTHYHDLAFQVNLLEKLGLKISGASVIHLNSEYIRQGDINVFKLFSIIDVTEVVWEIKEAVAQEMQTAIQYIASDSEPLGYCDCIYKGRSAHCSTFLHSNPKIPAYGVHDISRIGQSKKKLQDLVDVGIFEFNDIPEELFDTLSPAQQNQIETHLTGRLLLDRPSIKKELDSLTFPLYFLDYETFPAAIPRFDGFSPYQQIPFQYSLYVLESPEDAPEKMTHHEFLFDDATDPSSAFLKSLQEHIGEKGSVIVWNKGFECKINNELAERQPNFKSFIEAVNARVYDLMEIFAKQYYVDKNFKGRVSIKNILPVLVPELSYKKLDIKEGGTASQKWNEMTMGNLSEKEKEKIKQDLKIYCGLDTYAMYAIWKVLHKLHVASI